jgi:hypothetical protein
MELSLAGCLRALYGAALVQHMFCRTVGMQDGAVFVGQHDGTAERIKGFGHPRARDGADIVHLADHHRALSLRPVLKEELAKANHF